MTPRRLPRFRVHTEDQAAWFKYKRELKEREIVEIFEERIAAWKLDLFPGLVLVDDNGNKLRPELQVILVPLEE